MRKRIIIPKFDLKYILENVTYLDTEELPMIIEPRPWKIDGKGEIIEYGGTLLNQQKKI